MNEHYPSQDKHIVGLFETLEAGQLQALIVSGLLTDLRRCAAEQDPIKVDRDQFQKVLGFDPSVFILKMGGANNTDEITKALGFHFDSRITQENFPLKPNENSMEDEIEIVDPGRDFGEEGGLVILRDNDLLYPTYEHAIRFAEQYGKATTSEKKPYVIFLHKPWHHIVLYLRRYPDDRWLGLHYPGHGFGDRCVLAGVRRPK